MPLVVPLLPSRLLRLDLLAVRIGHLLCLCELALPVGRSAVRRRIERVDVALEEQNRDLLQSMDRRVQLQLRLQQTVEGLSVVAISYYVMVFFFRSRWRGLAKQPRYISFHNKRTSEQT